MHKGESGWSMNMTKKKSPGKRKPVRIAFRAHCCWTSLASDRKIHVEKAPDIAPASANRPAETLITPPR